MRQTYRRLKTRLEAKGYAGVRRTLPRLSAKEARDVENVIQDMRGRITRERITLKPSFKVGV